MNLLTPLIPHVLGHVLNQGGTSLNLGKRALGGVFFVISLGLGTLVLYKSFIPFFGDIISGLIISGTFSLIGGILWCSKRQKPRLSPEEVLSKAGNVVENLHLPANFEKHTSKFIGIALGTGVLLAYLLSHKKN